MIKWDSVEKYVKSFCQRNIGKVQTPYYSKDDLYQDCWITYGKCCKSFTGKTEQDFMTFFKSALFNHIKNMRRDIRNEKSALDKYTQTETEDGLDSYVGLRIKLTTAPELIKKIFNLLVNQPVDYDQAKHHQSFENNITAISKYLGYKSARPQLIKNFKEFILS